MASMKMSNELRKEAERFREYADKFEEFAKFVEVLESLPKPKFGGIPQIIMGGPKKDFKDLSIKEAAFQVIRNSPQPIAKEEIIGKMREMGYEKEIDPKTLSPTMSRDKRLKHIGDGKWVLLARFEEKKESVKGEKP